MKGEHWSLRRIWRYEKAVGLISGGNLRLGCAVVEVLRNAAVPSDDAITIDIYEHDNSGDFLYS